MVRRTMLRVKARSGFHLKKLAIKMVKKFIYQKQEKRRKM
jgi:hypothetical protein